MTRQRVLLAAVLGCAALQVYGADYRSSQAILEGIHGEPCREGRPLSYWIRALESRSSRVRKDAVTRIGEIGVPARQAIPALLRMTRQDHIGLRSWAINQGLGHRNFNSFVNGYRIAEVKAALADPRQAEVPVLTIALDAGFNSLGPFNRAFKAETGLTPTEYRRLNSGIGEQIQESASPIPNSASRNIAAH